jgi:hypothetical protein
MKYVFQWEVFGYTKIEASSPEEAIKEFDSRTWGELASEDRDRWNVTKMVDEKMVQHDYNKVSHEEEP